MLYYINSPGYQIIKIIKVFPNPEIQRHIAKNNMFSAHFYRTKLSQFFFMIFRYIAKQRPFFEIHMCILQIILFLIFLEFQKQLLLIISIIFHCFNYFKSLGLAVLSCYG